MAWIELCTCRCGRVVWQRPELWTGVCHQCSDDCLMKPGTVK